MGEELGIVLPVYDEDTEELNNYLIELEEKLAPDKFLVEVDLRKGVKQDDTDIDLKDSRYEVNYHRGRRGKGLAISQGWDKLDTDLLMFLDSDGSVPAEDVGDMVKAMEDSDLVVGSRRIEGDREIVHESFVRRHLGDLLVRLAQTTLDVELEDYQCGAKLIRRSVWMEIEKPEASGFSWDLELIQNVSEKGYRIEEVPVSWIDRENSSVPVVRTSVEMLLTLGKLMKSLKRRKIILEYVIGFSGSSNTS